MAKFEEGLRYSESHEYIRVEGEYGYIGISDYAHISPVSGTVVEVNEALEDQPELLNEDAFANWIIKVQLSDPSELESLMDAKTYATFCEE